MLQYGLSHSKDNTKKSHPIKLIFRFLFSPFFITFSSLLYLCFLYKENIHQIGIGETIISLFNYIMSNLYHFFLQEKIFYSILIFSILFVSFKFYKRVREDIFLIKYKLKKIDKLLVIDDLKFSNKKLDWYEAMKVFDNIKYAGHNNWRLASSDELKEIYKNRKIFSNLYIKEKYWSFQTTNEDDDYAWHIGLEYGYIRPAKKNNSFYTIYVCDIQ